MTFNQDGWFAKRFLGVEYPSELPQTVCQLLWHTLWASLFHLLIIITGTLCAISLFNVIYYRYDVSVLTANYGDFWPALFFILAFLAKAGIIIALVFRFVVPCVDKLHKKRYAAWMAELDEWGEKYVAGEITRDEYRAWYDSSKYSPTFKKQGRIKKFFTPIVFVAVAIFERIHNKTCVMIQWGKKSRTEGMG